MGFIVGLKSWLKIHKLINVIYHINIIKDKNHMILSTDAHTHTKKHLQNFFMTKLLKKLCIENMYLRSSLVVQKLRICLQMLGTWVRSLIQEVPTCLRATNPVCYNKRSHCNEKPLHCNYRAVPTHHN